MSRTIEENVVKMRFDNSGFNQNVESSEKQLSSFKSTLLTLPSAIGLGLSNTLRSVNLSDVIGVGAALTGVRLLKSGISEIGGVVQSVAAIGMNSVNSVMSAAINQVKEGGMQRALNIEAAKFQLEGLNLDVKTFMEAANFAVSDTAYSLDAAAKAAAQFGASGITELEELKKALRGVSGVASMTNSSYEEISNIFTTVAGNGRLMSMQLQQFSSRGLNVAAELGKALNKTEAEIRDMVSHGEIDFKTFALAMDTAFGEHAKDANKTFTGAMANVRAALSKIGAEFASPYIQNMITFYNELRLSINSLKQELIDYHVFDTFAENIEKVIKQLSKLVENIRWALEQSSFMEEISNVANFLFEKLSLFIDAFTADYGTYYRKFFEDLSVIPWTLRMVVQILTDVFDKVYGIRKAGADFIMFVSWIGSLLTKFANKFSDYYHDIEATIESWARAFKEVAEIVADVLGINKGNIEKIFDSVTTGIFEIIKSLKITDETSDKVKRTIKGFVSVIDVIKSIAKQIWDIIKQIAAYIPGLGDNILTISASLGDWFTKARDYLNENRVIETVFERISKIVEFITKLLGSVGTSFMDAFFGEGADSKSFVEKIKEFGRSAKQALKDVFGNFDWGSLDLSPIKNFFSQILGLDIVNEDTVEEAEEKKSFIVQVFEFFGMIFDAVKSFFSTGSGSSTSEETNKMTSKNGFSGFIEVLGDVIIKILDAIKDTINGIQITPRELSVFAVILLKIIDAVKDIIIAFLGFASVVAKYGIPALATGGVMDAIEKFFNMFNFTFGGIGDFFKHLGELDIQDVINTAIHGKEKLSELFYSLAAFFGGIAAALLFLSLVRVDKLIIGATVLYVIIQLIGSLVVALRILSGILPNMNQSLAKLSPTINKTTDGFNLFNNRLIDLRRSGNNTLKFLDVNSGFFDDIGELIKAFGWLIFDLSLALGIMNKFGGTASDILRNAVILGAFAVLVTGMVALFEILGSLTKDRWDSKNFEILKDLFGTIGVLFLEISASFAIINKFVQNPETLWSTFAVIAILFAEIATIIALLGGLTDIKEAIIGGVSLIIASNALFKEMIGLASVIAAIGQIPDDQLTKAENAIIVLLGIITGIALVITVLGLVASKSKLALLGIAAIGLIFAELGIMFVGIAAVAAAWALCVKMLTDLVAAFTLFMETAAELDGNALLNASKKVSKAWSVLAVGIVSAINVLLPNLFAEILKYIPKFIGYVCSTILSVIPTINDSIFKGIIEIIDFINAHWDMAEQALYGLLFVNFLPDFLKWMDELWDQLTAWVKERIPVVIPDIIEILHILIDTINAAMEGNWDEFDEGLQKLINNTIHLVRDLLTGETTWEEISAGLHDLVEHMKNALESNKDGLKELLEEFGSTMAGSIIMGFINGLKQLKWSDITSAWKDGTLDEIEEEMNEETAGVVNPHKTNLNSSSSGKSGTDWWSIIKGLKNKDVGTDIENALQGITNDAINGAVDDLDLGEDYNDLLGGFDLENMYNYNAKNKQAQVNVTLYGDASKFFEAETKYQNKLVRSGIY